MQVTVIDKTAQHLFQPLLYQVATGILSKVSLRRRLGRSLITSRMLRYCSATSRRSTLLPRQTHRVGPFETVTPYDSLIVSAGAGQSYFGHDEFADFAPGLQEH